MDVKRRKQKQPRCHTRGRFRFRVRSFRSVRVHAAFDQGDFVGPIESAAERSLTLFGQNRAFDRDQVSFSIVRHGHVAGQNHRTSVSIFLRNRGVSQNPESAVGMHEEQLPR